MNTEVESRIENAELEELSAKTEGRSIVDVQKIDLVKDVKVELTAIVGSTEISVGELFDLKENQVLKLNKETNAPLELMLDGKLVARGSLIVVDDNFGIQINEVSQD